MVRKIGRLINKVLGIINIRVTTRDKFDEIYRQSLFYWNDPFLDFLKHPQELKLLINESKSQVRQDLFVISELDFKSNGYFVEIGAQDGISGSNTYLLETKFSWDGIVIEPSRTYSAILRKNRRCKIENLAIWRESGKSVMFIDLGFSGLSAFKSHIDKGLHAKTRLQSEFQEYFVSTLSLNDLLSKHNAPKLIDYISIDTEGTEFDILDTFDFNKYDVRLISIEHNYDEIKRNKIHEKLTANGFTRKYIEISHQDDWYVKTK